jgi:uncharacterized C2H2 Zn-finger protein
MKEDKKQDEQIDISKLTGDFQCFACGAIFSTDEDGKQHLEKEAHGQLRDDETTEEKEIAKEQEELEESHPHYIYDDKQKITSISLTTSKNQK